MNTPLELYVTHLQTITRDCADPWFAVELAAYRCGDEAAGRRISESCLRDVLEIARRVWHPDCSLTLLDLVQEGNGVLSDLVHSFRGRTAPEFRRELAQQIEQHLTLLITTAGPP